MLGFAQGQEGSYNLEFRRALHPLLHGQQSAWPVHEPPAHKQMSTNIDKGSFDTTGSEARVQGYLSGELRTC